MAEKDQNQVALAFVVLSAAGMPSLAAFEARLKERLPGFPGGVSSDNTNKATPPWVWEHGGGMISVALLEVPIPWPELEYAAACSQLMWPGAADQLRAHKAHVLVAFSGKSVSRTEANWIVTQAAAAVLDVHPEAFGVYWGNAGLVHRKDIFLGFAEDAEEGRLAVPLWVAVRISQDGNGTLGSQHAPTFTVSTMGLHALGEMEIEAADAPGPARDLFFSTLNLASYILTSERKIQDGDTFGPDADTRIKVRHAPSMWEADRTVYRIEYGS